MSEKAKKKKSMLGWNKQENWIIKLVWLRFTSEERTWKANVLFKQESCASFYIIYAEFIQSPAELWALIAVMVSYQYQIARLS